MSRRARTYLNSDDTSVTLDDRWRELFGSEPAHKKADFLRQAIAWREQVLAYGDVSPAVQRDLKITAAPVVQQLASRPAAKRGALVRHTVTALPPASSQLIPGTRLVKAYGGVNHVVEVISDGFTYAGDSYASLSAIAKVITGTHWNGLLFFGLRKRKIYPKKPANG